MEFSAGGLTGKLMRLGAVVAIAATLGACSVIPSWMGGDSGSSSSSDVADASDTAAPPADQSAADSTTASTTNGQFPDLADTPDRPAPASTSDEQKRVADSLAADRSRQNYSADALRAGAEAQAAPPSATPPPDDVAEVDTGSKSGSSSDADSSSSSGDSDSSNATADAGSAAPATTDSAPASAPTTAVASAQTAAPAAPSGGLPAVPASSSINGAQSIAMSDAALGFQASKAPPLDASVAQFVPMPIMSRYQQTASLGGAAGLSGSPYAGGPAVPAVPSRAMGGPERMTGAVVANYDALQGGAVAPAVAYSNAQGLPAAAVIAFSDATTILSADAKAQIRAAAESFNARGGTGYIRVVGHASTSSTKVSEARRLELNFERSQARATSVMRELIKDGVAANKILIDAVGDSQPAYNAAAQGENGNRRAEIFFQG
jgi:outer membrane protein OmpA-like peptidoglycan-associated protein